MSVGSSGSFGQIRKLSRTPQDIPGAVVIGGDYQGLGIVRSLGRRGVPVCILDDERSISRYSRYATYGVRVPDLRNQNTAVETLLDLAKRLDLKGWVLFPTRDELVAAISHHRTSLSEVFRVPTPCWDTIQWVWNKRNTYRLAREVDIPNSGNLVSGHCGGSGPDYYRFSAGSKTRDQRAFFLCYESKGLACRHADTASGIIFAYQSAAGTKRDPGPGFNSRGRQEPGRILCIFQRRQGGGQHGEP